MDCGTHFTLKNKAHQNFIIFHYFQQISLAENCIVVYIDIAMMDTTKQKKNVKPRELHAQGGTVPLPGIPDIPHSRIELMLSARNLKDKDVLSKSDPVCVVYLMMHKGDKQEPKYTEIGRTEVIDNNLNPQWETKIQLDYFFEDIDTGNTRDLASQDFLGRCECHLADIVAAADGALRLKLRDEPGQAGELIIRAEEVDKGQKEILYLVCHGQNVASLGICSCCYSTDPFMEFHRIYQNGLHQLVHRTEVRKNTVNPEFNPIEINVRHLCEGEKDRDFLVRCYDFKFHGKHKLLGSARLSVNQLTVQKIRSQLLVLEKKSRKETGGALHFLKAECKREFTWLDFVKGGMQLEFAVAIDFTASNGDINQPGTRHYIDQFCLNQYELAIRSVLEICEHYNSTKVFEAFGFGAKIKNSTSQDACHFFPLNIESWQSEVYGVKGVMDAYRSALGQVQLYGPTNFEPTIRHMLKKCRTFPKDGSRYQILLILTDGLITDMELTKMAIIEASDQPLSIIIIGVGDEDFAKMDELDSDDALLRHRNVEAQRDIVQFVPFSNYYGAIRSANSPQSVQQQTIIQAELAKAVLEEIPYQVTSYCKMNKIQPKNIPSSNTDKPLIPE